MLIRIPNFMLDKNNCINGIRKKLYNVHHHINFNLPGSRDRFYDTLWRKEQDNADRQN